MTNNNLTDFQKDQLLSFFAHYMPMEQRELLMATLPRVYNAWCGRKVVEVKNVTHGWVCHAPLDKCEEQKSQYYNGIHQMPPTPSKECVCHVDPGAGNRNHQRPAPGTPDAEGGDRVLENSTQGSPGANPFI